MEENITLKCSSAECQKRKNISEFYEDRSRSTGRMSRCIVCCRAAAIRSKNKVKRRNGGGNIDNQLYNMNGDSEIYC